MPSTPAERPFSPIATHDKAQVEALAMESDELQNLLYADKRHTLLVVLQGIDSTGDDGTLRGVLSRISPLGVPAVGWKAPIENKRAHDFLWRIHPVVPGACWP